jgi:hypothetical protein
MSTTMKCFLPAVLAVTALLNPISARTADAQTWWSKVAAGCVVDTASAAKASLDSGFGTVSFKGAKLGRIRLTCPISGLFNSAQILDSVGMNVSFYDPDGRATGCAVRASLLRTHLGAQERGLDIVSFDSNSDFVATEPGTGRSTGSEGAGGCGFRHELLLDTARARPVLDRLQPRRGRRTPDAYHYAVTRVPPDRTLPCAGPAASPRYLPRQLGLVSLTLAIKV